jgi:polyisoprenoid-binding protein YceI
MTTTLTNTKWTVDNVHSVVQFKVKHLAISTVTGTFRKFHGEVSAADDTFNGAEVSFSINADSIDTNHAGRDKDLKGQEFLFTEHFPGITFQGVLNYTEGDYYLEGALTIRDVTKNVKLDVEPGGIGKGRFGDTRAGFEVNGKINRKEFGLSWSLLTETGGLVVGEEVKLHFDIQLIKGAQNPN